jgi:hypothetical protein
MAMFLAGEGQPIASDGIVKLWGGSAEIGGLGQKVVGRNTQLAISSYGVTDDAFCRANPHNLT